MGDFLANNVENCLKPKGFLVNVLVVTDGVCFAPIVFYLKCLKYLERIISSFQNAPAPPPAPGYDPPFKNNSSRVVVDDDLEGGGGGSDGGAVGFASASFSDVSVRAGFIRKVYFTLSIQLAITFAIVAVFVLNDSVKNFIQKNFMLYYVGYAFFLVTYFILICCEAPRRKECNNILMHPITFNLRLFVCLAANTFKAQECSQKELT